MANQTRTFTLWFVLIAVGYVAYAAIFIFQSSFVISGERFFTLFDDAMIAMRYARNLANGFGLVWNPGGEGVEGFTNPLWTLYMAFFHLLGISQSKMGLPLQVSGALCLLINIYFVGRLCHSLSHGAVFASVFAMIFTAFYYPLSNWALLGMEVGALTLLTTVCAGIAVGYIRAKHCSPGLYLLLGLGILVRLDMVVVFLTIWGFLVFVDKDNRKAHLMWGILTLALVVGGQTLLRWLYFGEALPNTYFLKMVGIPLWLRIARGLYVFAQFVWDFNWVLFLFPLSLLLFRRDKAVLVLFALVTAFFAYSVYVGGDAWEHRGGSNRFVSIVMPLFFLLFALTINALCTLLIKIISGMSVPSNPQTLSVLIRSVGTGYAILSLITFNALVDISSLRYWLLLEPSIFVSANERWVRTAKVLTDITSDDAVLAVYAAGSVPYYTNRNSIDMLGKMDKVIARQKIQLPPTFSTIRHLRPGHDKWDLNHSIGKLQPDVIVGIFHNRHGDSYNPLPMLERYFPVQFVNLRSSKHPSPPKPIDYERQRYVATQDDIHHGGLRRIQIPGLTEGFMAYFRKRSPHIHWTTLGWN